MDVFTLTHDLGMSQLGLGLQLIDSVQNSPALGNEYYGYWCQRKVEMSGFSQDRTVRFHGFLQGCWAMAQAEIAAAKA
jgi:hypothetical protein